MKHTPHLLLTAEDLTKEHVTLTRQTYDRFAREYADQWEWNSKTIQEVKTYNILPFLKHVKSRSSLLIAECQSGRDYKLFSEKGFRCLGVGFSYGLLVEAIRRVPDGLFIQQDVQSLPFLPESFDGIYADAMTMVPKRDLGALLKDYRIFLRPGGVLYLSLKIHERNVLVLNDLGGPRYATLYRQQEIESLVGSSGMNMVWQSVSPHTYPSLPKWFSLIAKKS